MSKADRAMGDIDQASSPSSQNSPPDAGKVLDSIDHCEHGGINSIVQMTPDNHTQVSYTSQFMDDTAQYVKLDNAGQLKIRNQAYGLAITDPSNPPAIGKQDSDPSGG
jgi:hypothetical protein